MTLTCGNCKYWKRGGFGGPLKDSFGSCRNPFVGLYEQSEAADTLLTVADNEYVGVEIQTGENFGCIKFTEKTP